MPNSSRLLFTAIVAGAILSPAVSRALISQVWVSGHGTDAANCGATTSPCRSFQYAQDHVLLAGGEIDVLDPADYGPVTITKAISIVNDGVGAATIVQSAAGMNAITINAGAGNSIHLRGLSLNGLGIAANGVALSSAMQVDLVNCVVRRFMSHGVDLEPITALNFTITNVIASENANAGVNLHPSASLVGSINGLNASYNVNGVQLAGDVAASSANIFVSVVKSVATNNNNGFAAFSASGHPNAKMAVSDSAASGNGAALYAGVGGQIAVARSNLVGNGDGAYSGAPGSIATLGDNNVIFNGANLSGPGGATPYPQK